MAATMGRREGGRGRARPPAKTGNRKGLGSSQESIEIIEDKGEKGK